MPAGTDRNEEGLAVGSLVFEQFLQECGVGDVGEVLLAELLALAVELVGEALEKSRPKMNSLNSEASILPRRMSAALKRKHSSWERVIFSRFMMRCTNDNPWRLTGSPIPKRTSATKV